MSTFFVTPNVVHVFTHFNISFGLLAILQS